MKILSQTLSGSKHMKNEDYHFISPELKTKKENYKLMMVADGISSYRNASELTKRFKEFMDNMNEKILFKNIDDLYKMKNINLIRNLNHIAMDMKSGSTLSILIIEKYNQKCLTYNMGDSPIYLIRNNKLLPIYGDCSLPAYSKRDYEKLSKLTFDNHPFYLIKPNEELFILRRANRLPVNSNMVMSALPFRTGIDKGHFFKYQSQIDDMILMGSDGFLSNYLYPNFDEVYVSIAKQVSFGGEKY
jgi:serine/threonine protein phosphatase PrpC